MTKIRNISKEESLTVEEVDTGFREEWIKFILKRPECSIYYHPTWLEVLEEETNQKIFRLICRDNSGQLVGILLLQLTKGVPFGIGGVPGTKRISSLPRTPVGGPVVSCDEALDLLIRKAIEISQDDTKCRLQIKSFSHKLNERIQDLSKHFWREVYFTDIPKYPEEIRFGNSKNHTKIKWGVNKALKSGVRIRYSESGKDILAWYKLYLDTMKFHTTPPRSLGFFNSLWENMKPYGLMKLVLAEIEDDENQRIIAGSIFLTFNKTVVYAFNGSSRNDFELRPNDLIHWTVMKDAQKEGYEIYDWGEVAKGQEGLAAYKEKWSSKKVDMYHYYYPDFEEQNEADIDSGTKEGIIKSLWNILPLKITSIIGSQVFKYL
ncbi:MAG TPA: GNAT family N-acetyltransferase [Ignavibacteriaceae bacterium]|nr:GNAT family N-acetyltransferase [Ignavibacteriaceae bacterium]